MNCKFLLDEKNMSVYACSKKSGIPYSTLSDIIKGRTPMESVSFRTAHALADTLGISMDELYEKTRVPKRADFSLFRSAVCHRLKELGDIPFILELLESNLIRHYYRMEWFPESLYLLAMLDYVSRENGVDLCSDYDDIREMRLTQIVFPASVLALSYASGSEAARNQALANSIPEFKRHNIAEGGVRDAF